jgi:prolyl-tRNA editing enzyme YbaK/EbsC (Cys-tRNA(Pro) deacylase)
MIIGKLDFLPILQHRELLSRPTAAYLFGLPGDVTADVCVAKIHPDYADGNELCKQYGTDPQRCGNCIVVEAKRGERLWLVACLVPLNHKMDLNGFVRRQLHARRVSLAPKEATIKLSGMEYGSINPTGLPAGWSILIDARLANADLVITGSGLVASKLLLPGKLLAHLPNATVVEGLGVPVGAK